MTVTNEMVEAAKNAIENLPPDPTWRQKMWASVEREDVRRGLVAALAVQPVPTDAEIEAAIEDFALAVMSRDRARFESEGAQALLSKHLESAGDSLLRLIAAQREADRREALEAVREWCVESGVYTFVIDHIDTMLAKEDGDE